MQWLCHRSLDVEPLGIQLRRPKKLRYGLYLEKDVILR
jgi:hypothetical protein